MLLVHIVEQQERHRYGCRDSGRIEEKGNDAGPEDVCAHRMPAKHTFGTRIADIKKDCEDDQRPAGTGVAVDVGDTDCTLPVASAYIEKMEAAGRLDMSRRSDRSDCFRS